MSARAVLVLVCIALAGCATRPQVQLPGYRSVLIEPARVEFAEGWYKHAHAYDRAPPRAIGRDEAQRLARDAAASFEGSLAEAFRAQGFEIATAAAPGVLRVSPAISDLYINAPDRTTPWRTRTFTRNAGDARLSFEARDAMSGALFARIEEKVVAEQMGRVALANEVNNRFWFDALFRRWAARSAAELAAARDRSS
jgi:hypothetical protein